RFAKAETTRYYYDIYNHHGDIRVTAFCTSDNSPGSFVFYPLIIPLMQSCVRNGHAVASAVDHAMATIIDKSLIEADIDIIHLSCRNPMQWKRTGFSPLCIADPGNENLFFAEDDGGTGIFTAEKGNLVIIFDTVFYRSIGRHYDDILCVLRECEGKSLADTGKTIKSTFHSLGSDLPAFMCLLRVSYL
ncbi:MAG: hypothetical protein ACRCUT_12905, partial [Spirochaetota bacterium]